MKKLKTDGMRPGAIGRVFVAMYNSRRWSELPSERDSAARWLAARIAAELRKAARGGIAVKTSRVRRAVVISDRELAVRLVQAYLNSMGGENNGHIIVDAEQRLISKIAASLKQAHRNGQLAARGGSR